MQLICFQWVTEIVSSKSPDWMLFRQSISAAEKCAVLYRVIKMSQFEADKSADPRKSEKMLAKGLLFPKFAIDFSCT